MKKIRTVVIDPPWKAKDKLPGKTRGAEKNYRCMSVDEIVASRSSWEFELADDAFVLMWRLASMQAEAVHILQSWGFTIKTEIVWRKRTRNNQRWFGMGRNGVRAEHEVCVVASQGRPISRLLPAASSTRSIFTDRAPWGLKPNGKMGYLHSAKPEKFYSLVEAVYPGPRVELFGRMTRPMFVAQYGDQMGVHDGVVA